jgi:type I restriction enzyme R subunit
MHSLSNFAFLQGRFLILGTFGAAAEAHLHADPAATLVKLRNFEEKLVEILFKEHRIRPGKYDTQENRIDTLSDDHAIDVSVATLLHILRKKGNSAAHASKFKSQDATDCLEIAFKLAKWLYAEYAEHPNPAIEQQSFRLPKKENLAQTIAELEQEKKQWQQKQVELELQIQQAAAENALRAEQDTALQQYQERRRQHLKRIEINEAETRLAIDGQLQEAGWEAHSTQFNYKKHKTLPQAGRNLAIAEWYCDGFWADYALFIGLKLVGLVEAKKQNTDVQDALAQVKRYAQQVTNKNAELLGEWSAYKVPFLFSTNGRPYNPQILTKSGIWFLDVRTAYQHARALRAWYAPQGLKELLNQNIELGSQNLQTQPTDYLSDKRGLSLRPYQLQAIQAVENQILRSTQQGARRAALLAMATGTGKTRTILGLCYRLLKANRFRRILFLVDRTILGEQSRAVFEENTVEQFQTFATIYNIAGLEQNDEDFFRQLQAQGKSDDATRLYFSTVQGMVKRIFKNPKPEAVPPVHSYDCIIVDEAHRGYLLDKELEDNTLSFRDASDFVSKYKAVLDYFDAFRIGLTATPARQTSDIFGAPVFLYSYRQAVLEGYLCDQEPPFQIVTQLNTEGIKWEKGEKPPVLQADGTLIDLAALDDELKIDVDGFNKKVVTIPFNETVCAELVHHLDIDSDQKTLIFAVDNAHADLVVQLLKKAFQDKGIETEEDAILKITGSVPQHKEWIKAFKNERCPNIVVTVDLLTTGVDIPQICNLVFLRRVNSRLLYDQMIGRATRLCPEISKESFRIFDAVRLYDALSEFSEMKPVVQYPNQPISKLLPELAVADNEAGFSALRTEIVAKMHRKRQLMDDEAKKVFAKIAQGKSPEAFIETFAQLSLPQMHPYIEQFMTAFAFLEGLSREKQTGKLFSQHPDTHYATVQLYDERISKPEDYLEKCRQYLIAHQNHNLALSIIATRPHTLTRKQLKALRAELDASGFTLTSLQIAWKNVQLKDIVVDIIALIRSLTLGETLIPKEERIQRAMQKIRALQKWSPTQLGWLKRIETRLKLEEPLIDPSFLDEDNILKDKGGFKGMNHVFDKNAEALLRRINEEIYSVSA